MQTPTNLPKRIKLHRDSIIKQISEGLTRARVDNDITQSDLSLYAQVAVNNISKYENGHTIPSMTYNLPWILDALGVEIQIKFIQKRAPKIKPRDPSKVGRLTYADDEDVKEAEELEKLGTLFIDNFVNKPKRK